MFNTKPIDKLKCLYELTKDPFYSFLIKSFNTSKVQTAKNASFLGFLDFLMYSDSLTPDCCVHSAGEGHLDCFKYLYSKFPKFWETGFWHSETDMFVAKGGHMELYKYLQEINFPFTCSSIYYSVVNKNMEMLMFGVENGHPLSVDSFYKASEHEDICILKYLYEKVKYVIENNTIDKNLFQKNLIKIGNIVLQVTEDELEYILETNGKFLITPTFSSMKYIPSLNFLKYFHELSKLDKYPWTETALTLVIPNIESVKFILSTGNMKVSIHHLYISISHKNIELFTFLYGKTTEKIEGKLLKHAADIWSIDILMFLIEKKCPVPVNMYLNLIKNEEVAKIKFLLEQKVTFNKIAYKLAKKLGNKEILNLIEPSKVSK